MSPVGVEHFFGAFALIYKRSIREAAAHALRIPIEDIQPNLVVKQARAQLYRLTPICVPDDPPAKHAKKTQEAAPSAQDERMASGEAKAEKESSTESNSDSSASNSDLSSEDGSSDVSDLDKFEEAYKEFGGLTAGVDDVDFDRIVAGNTNDDVPGLVLEGGLETLQTLANVPKTWPLARLTVPLSGFSKQLERLLEGYCMEVMATNAQSGQHLLSIKTFAKEWSKNPWHLQNKRSKQKTQNNKQTHKATNQPRGRCQREK